MASFAEGVKRHSVSDIDLGVGRKGDSRLIYLAARGILYTLPVPKSSDPLA